MYHHFAELKRNLGLGGNLLSGNMAKRSDFAQKLLDDLRIRKERMTSSQSSKSSQPTAGDAYSHSKQAYRGSREMKLHQNTNLKSGRAHSRSTGGNKSVSIRESLQDIVPLGRGLSSEQSRDLFMALASALENGGKLARTDSSSNNNLMLGLLNQMGTRSEPMNKIKRINNTSTSHFPSLSCFHIDEIAKGAQKLNQILRACSNGLNLDRCSIEIGREILKGAVDLEESLRMLANLQETSDYTIGPKNKAQITLLDDDGDDNDSAVKTTENKQLARPVFSFDMTSRNSPRVHELKQMLMALTYQPENKNNKNRITLGTSNSASQRNSPCIQTVAAFSEQKNHSSSTKSKPEKRRIPNVIAKLMGLEELPENDDAKHIIKKEFTHKEKIEHTATKKPEGRTAQHWRRKEGSIAQERRTKDTGNIIQDSHHFQAQMHQASRPASSDGTIHDSKPPQKDVERKKLPRCLKKTTDKHQNNNDQSTPNIGSRNDIWNRGGKLDSSKLKEQKSLKCKPREPIVKHQPQKMASRTEKASDTAITLQGQEKSNPNMLKAEGKNAYEQPLNNKIKSPIAIASQQPPICQHFEAQEVKHHEIWSDQQSRKKQIQLRGELRNENMSLSKLMQGYSYSTRKPSYRSHEAIHLSRGTQLPNTRNQEDTLQNNYSFNSNMTMQDSFNKTSIQNSSPRILDSEAIKERTRSIITTDTEEKIIHKVKVSRVPKTETPQKIDELVTKSTNMHKLARTSKHQSLTSQEVALMRHNKLDQSIEDNQLRLNRSRELEAKLLKSNKLELTIARQNGPEEVQIQAEQDSSFCTTPADNQCHSRKRSKMLAADGHGIFKSSTVLEDQQSQGVNHKLQSDNKENNLLNRICEDSRNAIHSQLQKRNEQILETLEPSTESENNLMQILIKSQAFLDTTEALFKLNIPLSIFQASSNDCHYERSKPTLDCADEVMKRKGKMKEYSHHPFQNMYITSPKIISLNDLIKQIHRDLEKLQFYGRNDKIECVAKMLEIDVDHKDPDINCMWDFGWHKMMFISLEEEDVIKDVEKHLLNGLLDELCTDLLVF